MFSCHPNTEQNVDKESNDTAVFKLPYRLVFAVATLNSLFVYDTQSSHPLAVLAGIHYAAITDIAWSCDGKFLAVSSQDGFCTLVAFDQEELGSPLPLSELPSYIAKLLPPAKDKVGQQDHPANASSMNSGDSGTPLQENEEANASSGSVMKASATQTGPVQESQHAGGIEVANSKDHVLSGSDKIGNTQSSPQRPKQMNPVAVDVSCTKQQIDKIENRQSSPQRPRQITPMEVDVSSTKQQMDKIENPQSSPERPRRITPMAVDVSSTKQQIDETENPQNSPDKRPRQITPVAVDVSCTKQQVDKIENPQSSLKRPRRITPVAMDVSCTEKLVDASSNDRTRCQEKQ